MCIRDSADTAQRNKLMADAQRLVADDAVAAYPVSYTHLRAHETVLDLVCRLLLEKKKKTIKKLEHTAQILI